MTLDLKGWQSQTRRYDAWSKSGEKQANELSIELPFMILRAMDNDNEISSIGIAEWFGVNKSIFNACVEHISDFPKPIRTESKRRIYSLRAVIIRSEAKDAARIFRLAYAQSRKNKTQEQTEDAAMSTVSMNAMRIAFLSGKMRQT